MVEAGKIFVGVKVVCLVCIESSMCAGGGGDPFLWRGEEISSWIPLYHIIGWMDGGDRKCYFV